MVSNMHAHLAHICFHAERGDLPANARHSMTWFRLAVILIGERRDSSSHVKIKKIIHVFLDAFGYACIRGSLLHTFSHRIYVTGENDILFLGNCVRNCIGLASHADTCSQITPSFFSWLHVITRSVCGNQFFYLDLTVSSSVWGWNHCCKRLTLLMLPWLQLFFLCTSLFDFIPVCGTLHPLGSFRLVSSRAVGELKADEGEGARQGACIILLRSIITLRRTLLYSCFAPI